MPEPDLNALSGRRPRSALKVPARAGVGLKAEHYRDILESEPDIGWFEVHPENYMGDGGPPHHFLERDPRSLPAVAARRWPVDRLGRAA